MDKRVVLEIEIDLPPMDEVGSIEWAVATATAAFRACDVSIKRLKAEEREV